LVALTVIAFLYFLAWYIYLNKTCRPHSIERFFWWHTWQTNPTTQITTQKAYTV